LVKNSKSIAKLFIWLHDGGFFKPNPYDKQSISGDDLMETALDNLEESLRDIHLDQDIAHKLRDWKASAINGDYEHFSEILQKLLVILGFKQLDPENPVHAASMANIGRFNELLSDFETASMMGGRKRNWDRDFKGLHWFINAYATSSYEEQTGDDTRGINAVQIFTVHQAKGLEWPIVFIPSLVKRRFPSSMAGREREWMIPRDMFNAEKYDGGIDDERKLLYVAMTRPKDVLVMSYFREMNGNSVYPSDFIYGINGDMVKHLDEKGGLSTHRLSLGGDPDELQTYTTGEILSYSRCPYQYRIRHIWGYQPGLKERVGYGNALHFCLRNAAGMIKDGINPLTAVATSVDKHFFLPFMSEDATRGIRQAAKKKLIQYTVKRMDDTKNIKEVETRIEFPLQRSTIAGRVDVILHNKNELEIRDYKTSDKVISQDEAELQIRLYSLGLRMVGEPITKASIAYLDDARVNTVGITENDIEKARQLTESYVSGIMNRCFEAKPGEHCKECDYHLICKHTMVE
jgi:DNA helicase-2/ATP-dependent DNA helicase PcrA